MIVMVLDATKRAEQRALLEAELEAVGIRLNQDPPNIYLKPKAAGGVKITFQAQPKNLDQKMLYNILKDYRILNAEVLIRDENGQYTTSLTPTLNFLYLDTDTDYCNSNRRPIHRRNNERSQNLHQMPLRLQQNRQRKSRIPRQISPRTQHSRHELRT